MDERWVTLKDGRRIKIKSTNDYMNDLIRNKNNEISVDDVTFQSEDYGKYIEEEDKNRIEIFKNILKTKKDDDYYGFKYKDIAEPITLRKEKDEKGRYKIYDGQHRYIAYKQLGYKKIPYKFKDN